MKYLIVFIAVLFCAAGLHSQTPNTHAVLDAFEKKDRQHLHREHDAFGGETGLQPYLFDTLLPMALERYERSPNRLLQIHLLRLRANAASNYRNYNEEKGVRPASIALTEEAIRLCYLEGDNLLLAETYFDMAELYNLYGRYEEYLTMLTRAFEIAEQAGLENFPGIMRYYKLAGMCKAAYRIHSYRESINYGLRAMRMQAQLKAPVAPESDIFLYDLIGAAYKQIQQPDSSIFFYQMLQAVLVKMDTSKSFYQLWSAIANGNTGECLSMKGEGSAAAPLLQQWLQAGIAFSDSANICLAENAIAANYFRQGNYQQATAYWKSAYRWSSAQQKYRQSKSAAEGLATVYKLLGHTDSAFYYFRQAQVNSDSLTAFINRSGLQAVHAKVKLDHLQRSLENSTALLKEEKRSKHLVLGSIVLLAVIAALLYNRQRLRTQNKLQRLDQSKREAELASQKAKEEIDNFVKHIKEKNDLIDSLREKLTVDEELKARQDIHESLAAYTLITDKEWEQFRAGFAKTYPSFFPAMAARLNQVTPAEERLATLIFLGFNNLQIANTLGIGRESVTRSRYRLKQRLALSKSDDLDALITSW